MLLNPPTRIDASRPPVPPSLPIYFDGDFTTQPTSANGVWPTAVHSATSGKTYFVWLAEGAPQVVRIAEYDHTTEVWSDAVTVRNGGLLDDVHGTPAIAIDHEGYLYVFWGSHGTTQKWAISAAPLDISAWNPQTALSSGYTYPKPVRFGTDLYLFLRVGSTSDSKYVVRKASPSGGVATFGTEVNLVDWTAANVGIYVTEVRQNGSEIEFMGCQQTGSSPQVRKHLFYFAWNPTTGALRNISGSVTVASGSLPVLYATATASFREFDNGSNITELGSWCRDSAGDLHVVFFDGSANPYPLKHMIHDGTSWSTPATVVSMNGRGNPRIRYLALVPNGADVELWYPDGAVGGWTLVGGDEMLRKVWSGGVWGSVETILVGSGTHALAHPSAVHDAHPNLRVMFSESGQTELFSERFQAKRYGHGDNGFTSWPIPADPYAARLLELIVYQGANGSKPTGLDQSWRKNLLSWLGNAAIQGNRLALDGASDGVRYGATGIAGVVRPYYFHGENNDNNGELAIDVRRVKFNSTSLSAALYARRGTGADLSLSAFYRGDLTPDQLQFEYELEAGATGALTANFTPNTTLEYDFRFSRDPAGVIRIHMAETGSDLVMVASTTIDTGPFATLTVQAPCHGAYDGTRSTLNGSIGGVRVTMDHRGTTDANIPASEMAFDT